jgi:hypothetical protein
MNDTDRTTILHAFLQNTFPFAVSCGFWHGFLPRFLDTKTDLEQENSQKSLAETILQEPNRKAIKKLRTIRIDNSGYRNNRWSDQSTYESIQATINQKSKQPLPIDILTTHASIDRETHEATPYVIASKLPSDTMTIYITSYDHTLTNLFIDSLINVFSTLGRWKAKSRWYGHLKKITHQSLSHDEQSVFEIFAKQHTQGIFPIINHYFPSTEDKKHIDRDRSRINLITKNAKRWWNNVFKGNITYIWPWSVIITKDNYRIQGTILVDNPPHAQHPSYSIASSFLFG